MLKKQKGKRRSDVSGELRAQGWVLSLLSQSHQGQRTEEVLGLQEGTLGQAMQGSRDGDGQTGGGCADGSI